MAKYLPGVCVAWLVTLAAATLGATAVGVASRPASGIGLPVLFVIAMSGPFALTALVVLLPIVAFVLTRTGRLWLAAVAGVAAAPVQILMLLAGGHILFRDGAHARPSLAEDVTAVLGHPSGETGAILLGFAVGGLALVAWAARRRLHLTSQ